MKHFQVLVMIEGRGPMDVIDFMQIVVERKVDKVAKELRAEPVLATMKLTTGATRTQASEYFFAQIQHYMYGGDTPLHMAAAAFCRPIAELLVSHGADCRGRNRRGAEPLHYACDGYGSDRKSQSDVIQYLVSVGADPNALDKSGVAPLHRAVRSRSDIAVKALIDAGAQPRIQNRSGSTPLHLAVQTTGASGSGSVEARQRQESIIKLLLQSGAKLADKDHQGKSVSNAATSQRIRELLSM